MDTQIKPTPSIGMLGKCEVRDPVRPGDGWILALAGATGDHYGGSVLDAVTGCGGNPPPQADPAAVAGIRGHVIRESAASRGRSLPGRTVGRIGGYRSIREITLDGALVPCFFPRPKAGSYRLQG